MPDIEIGGGAILTELQAGTCPIKSGVGGAVVDGMGPGIRNEGLNSRSQAATILRLEAVVAGLAMIRAKGEQGGACASRSADLAPYQIVTGRANIPGSHDVIAVEGVFNRRVPLLDERQAEAGCKAEDQLSQDKVPRAYEIRDIQWAVIHQIGRQAEARIEIESHPSA